MRSWIIVPFLGSLIFGADERPNILFVNLEDIGPHLSLLGTPEVSTPVLDKLAGEGLYFTQTYTSGPTCSVSKAALYTGHYPHSNNLRSNVDAHASALSKNNAVFDSIPSITELLKKAGYRTALSGKFHVYPPTKFVFDERNSDELKFMSRTDKPWFLIPRSEGAHRPHTMKQAGPDPDRKKVDYPGHLPDLPVVRDDWAQYLRKVQGADKQLATIIDKLVKSGQKDKTIIIITSDHGPCYHARGKYTPYSLGMHVPLIIIGPEKWVKKRPGHVTSLVNHIDLMPTILDYAGAQIPVEVQGISLRPFLEGKRETTGNDYTYGEVTHRNGGMDMKMVEERTVYDGRYRLVFHDNRDLKWFQPADATNVNSWKNYVYQAVIDNKAKFPKEYNFLAQRDHNLPERPPEFELFDVQNDKWEVNDIFGKPEVAGAQNRLIKALKDWAIRTHDKYIDISKLKYDASGLSVNRLTNSKSPIFSFQGRTVFVNIESSYRLEVRNIKNEIIKSENSSAGLSNHTMNPGVYFFTVYAGQGVHSQKLVLF